MALVTQTLRVATVLQDNENEMNQRYPAGSRGTISAPMEVKGEREWSVFVLGASCPHRQKLEEKGDGVTLSVPREV
jgi:hypothetical protein